MGRLGCWLVRIDGEDEGIGRVVEEVVDHETVDDRGEEW